MNQETGNILFVDDNSPDGTGKTLDEMVSNDARIHALHRQGKQGLGRAYRNAKGVSGATIMGNGTVALILDIPELVHLSESDNLKF